MKTAPLILCGILALSILIARTENLPVAAQGIVDAERAFALLAKKANTRDAFLANFTDETLTFGRGPQKGKAHILKETVDDSLLEWAPIFVDVASSGDFGYDLGPWAYRSHRVDSSPVAWGTFVTIWKKQLDGVWRVALDLGIAHGSSTEAVPPVPATSVYNLAKIEAALVRDFRADLLAVERDYISRFLQGDVDAYVSLFSTEARLYRPGLMPVLSPSAIISYFETQREIARPVYELIDGESASTGDLGYVYGWVTTETLTAGKPVTKRANYLRIWKCEDGRNWKLVVDLIGAN